MLTRPGNSAAGWFLCTLLTLFHGGMVSDAVVLAMQPWIEQAFDGTELEFDPAAEEQTDLSWRRTTRGWESSAMLHREVETAALPAITGVHPALVAIVQVLLVVASFLIWDKNPGGSGADRK